MTVKSFVEVAKKWNVKVFGNFHKKKKVLIAHIKGI